MSSSESCFGETLSTLKFAQRAKMIRNNAIVNEDTSGCVEKLQKEIQRLKAMLIQSGNGFTANSIPVPTEEHNVPAFQTQSVQMGKLEQEIALLSQDVVRREQEIDSIMMRCREKEEMQCVLNNKIQVRTAI